MKITIACVGKVKEKFFREGIAEYTKRLSGYCHVEFVEVADEKTPEGASAHEEDLIREKEGKRLLSKIPENDYVIALAIDGKSFSSEEFASHMAHLMTGGKSHLVFVIGGSLGLSPEVLRRADEKLSFSRFTFPHQLMRLILSEQIYRSFRIMNHEPYHK